MCDTCGCGSSEEKAPEEEEVPEEAPAPAEEAPEEPEQ